MSSRGMEAFAPYHLYLDNPNVWPREDSRGELEFVTVEEMAARHAASALQKLLRWSRTMSAEAHLNIHHPADRVVFVRNTPLGQALAHAAQGLPAPEEDEPAEVQSLEADMKIVLTVLTAIDEANPELAASLGMHDTFALAVGIAKKIKSHFELSERH